MASKKKKTAEAAGELGDTTLTALERTIEDLLSPDGGNPSWMPGLIGKLRKQLAAACRERAFDVIEIVFARLVAVGAELLLRSELQLRHLTEYPDRRKGASDYPRIDEAADRIGRIARSVLECAANYGKALHVSKLARRPKNDGRVIDFESAKKRTARRSPRTDRGRPRKKALAGKRA